MIKSKYLKSIAFSLELVSNILILYFIYRLIDITLFLNNKSLNLVISVYITSPQILVSILFYKCLFVKDSKEIYFIKIKNFKLSLILIMCFGFFLTLDSINLNLTNFISVALIISAIDLTQNFLLRKILSKEAIF